MTPRLRKAAPADAAALADLGRRTFLETFGHVYRSVDLDAFLEATYTEARQLRELEDPRWLTLLAEVEGSPAGFAQLVRGNPVPSGDWPDPVELNRLYCLKAFHGRGLGEALMGAAVAQAGRTLWLGVWEHNARALAFYHRWGFVRVGEHAFQVGSRSDLDFILVREA